MKKLFLFLLTLAVIPVLHAAPTDISGTISNNTTLTTANSPYTVTGHITVNAGVTLTVEAGVELRFNSNIYLVVYGELIANSATFTANASTTPGFWQGIYVSYQSNANYGLVELNNCIVEYAQSLFVRKGELILGHNTLVNNFSSYGLDIYTLGTVTMDSTTIQNCSYPAYFRDNGGNGHWSLGDGVSLTGNSTDYVYINFRDVNSDFTLPDPGIPYYYDSELRITSTGTLMLEPGVSLLGNTGAYISVQGKFKANGTVSEPVLFSNEPSNAYWAGINFNDGAVDTACILNHCKFTGANYVGSNYRPYEIPYVAVEIVKSSPEFNDCEFSNNRYNLVVTGSSFPVFNNCNFMESTYVGGQILNINMDLNATPVFNNTSIAFNASEGRAIGIIGSTVYDDSHLTHQSFTGLDSISFMLYGGVVIHDTASLEIDPGIVIKCNDNDDYIQANGALTGVGTSSMPIIFTHRNDDNYGNPGDTYDDGTTAISNSTSGRLILAGLATSNLEYWKIHYGGRNSSSYAVYAYNGNSVENCEIKYSHRGILFSGDAQVLNNSFENITNYPLGRRMNAGSPVLIGNTITNSGNLGIFVHDFLDGTYSIEGYDIGGTPNAAYILDHDTPVPVGANVTILPGTVFKSVYYYGKLSVRGGLKAKGLKNNKIIFTSIYDNSAAGNTNFNSGTDPTGNKWGGIEFYNSSNDGLNELSNCEVRYVINSIRMSDCHVVMDSVLLNFSDNYAVSVFGSANPEITNCAFNNLNNAPVYMDMFANPTFSGNTIANVSYIGIRIRGGTISGTVPSRSFAGYDNITYLMFENLRIDDELNIPAGITFKGNGNIYFDIYGTFNVLGTEANPVVFTSLQDDSYGNPMDTQQNGAGSISKHGNRLVYRDIADDNSIVNHAMFRHSYSYAIYMASVSPTIKNSSFFNTGTTGLYLVGTATPAVDSCNFEDLPFPIITSLMTFPGSYQGNILSGSTAKGILVIDNETLTQDFTVDKKSFAGIDNIPYIFNRYNVGTSAVMTISPGVVLKFRQNGYMLVRNGLIADGGGTPDSAIVFTSDRDDFYGGDTYGDGEASQANNRWWYGIYFPEESIDGSCFMDNCIIKNGSRNYSNSPNVNNRGGVTIDNASPTIQNCLFEDNFNAIIVRNTSLPVISNCDFVETNPTYGYGVWNESGIVTVTAENCWWNDATGPYNASSNPGGLGERVSDNVDFTPWITQTAKPIMGDISLNGEIMPYDASLVLQHTVGNITLDSKQLGVADVSSNGTVTSYDASLILQFSIGLITNFDQPPPPMKSGTVLKDLMLTTPSNIMAGSGSTFEIPLSISTPSLVKSLDLQIASNSSHLRFKGLNTKNMPTDVMVASGYQAGSGILKVSLASALDLDLNLDELGLIFEINEPQTERSKVELIGLMANETQINENLFTTTVESQEDATSIQDAQGISSLQLYRTNEMIYAELSLVKSQSNLVLSVHDMAGRLLNTISVDNVDAGSHTFSFNANSNGGTGNLKFCLVSIQGDDFSITRKLIVK